MNTETWWISHMKCVQRCEIFPWKMRTSLNLTIFFFTINQIFFSVVFVVISDLVFVSFSASEFCNCSLSWLPMTPSCMFLPLSIYYVYLSLSLKRHVTEFLLGFGCRDKHFKCDNSEQTFHICFPVTLYWYETAVSKSCKIIFFLIPVNLQFKCI